MKTVYVLVCRECGDGDDMLPMPFESAEASSRVRSNANTSSAEGSDFPPSQLLTAD